MVEFVLLDLSLNYVTISIHWCVCIIARCAVFEANDLALLVHKTQCSVIISQYLKKMKAILKIGLACCGSQDYILCGSNCTGWTLLVYLWIMAAVLPPENLMQLLAGYKCNPRAKWCIAIIHVAVCMYIHSKAKVIINATSVVR